MRDRRLLKAPAAVVAVLCGALVLWAFAVAIEAGQAKAVFEVG